jgi:cell division protein FtsN
MVWPIAAAALSVVALGAVTWIVYDAVMIEPSGGAVPYISAEVGPEKIRPQQEGGLEVPNQNIRVYNELNGSPAVPEAEVLLPDPEVPLAPPVTGQPQVETPTMATEALGASSPQPDIDPAAGSATQPTETQAAGISSGQPEGSSAAASSAEQAGSGESSPAAAAAEAFRIQLIAVKNREAAQAAWRKMTKAHPEILKGLAPNIMKVDRGAEGVLYRVQGGPFADRAAAESACGKLKKRSQDCLVVAPSP